MRTTARIRICKGCEKKSSGPRSRRSRAFCRATPGRVNRTGAEEGEAEEAGTTARRGYSPVGKQELEVFESRP